MLFGSLLVAKSISATLIFDGACIPVLSSAAKVIVMPSHALGLEINPFLLLCGSDNMYGLSFAVPGQCPRKFRSRSFLRTSVVELCKSAPLIGSPFDIYPTRDGLSGYRDSSELA